MVLRSSTFLIGAVGEVDDHTMEIHGALPHLQLDGRERAFGGGHSDRVVVGLIGNGTVPRTTHCD